MHSLESLKDIVKGCLKGRRDDQLRLYNRYSGKMYGLCLRYARDQDEAGDILQEGFIRVFARLDSFRWQGSLEGWIRRIMVHTAIEKYRERLHWMRIEELNEEIEGGYQNLGESRLGMRELLSMIQRLPDRYRLVFNLFVQEGYNHREISEMLGITESASRSNLSRARTALQEMIRRENKELINRLAGLHPVNR